MPLRTGERATLALAALLAGALVGLELAVDDDDAAILFLLGVPIALVAIRLERPAGLAAAAAALAIVLVRGAQDDPFDYVTRAVVFFEVAWLGALVHKPAREERSGPVGRLVTSPPEIHVGPHGELLSPREREVLELVARGATNAQIAARFVISEETVKSHVKHILHKLDAGNRTEAALRYVELYGRPAPEADAGAPGLVHSPNPTAAAAATGERRARVAALTGEDRARLKLDDGPALEVPLLETLREHVDVGDPALLYLDRDGVAVGWYLPDAGLGVDMRHTGPS
jgi:DNA-binding CsgD family transcriptional regulator